MQRRRRQRRRARGDRRERHHDRGALPQIQAEAYITAYCAAPQDDVFIAPYVVTTNDNFMGLDRAPPQGPAEGLHDPARRACRRRRDPASRVIEIGEEAFIGAGALVLRDVPPRVLVMVGVPARHLRDVPDEELLED